jgi:hypothetical protein
VAPVVIGETLVCMSKTSFIVFSTELYADSKGLPAPEVYQLFKSSHLLDMLASDYEDLHGMSWEYLLPMYDEYLAQEQK